jgi:hypothetical protein
VVQSAEESPPPAPPTCTELTQVKIPEAAPAVAKSSIASLPTSWLPFKKRKLSIALSLEVPISNISVQEKTPEKAAIPKPSLQSSASGTPPDGKTNIFKQICLPSAGSAEKEEVAQDDVQASDIFLIPINPCD